MKAITRPAVVAALALLCCLLWGSAFPCIKIGYRLFEIPADAIGSQLLFAGIRFFLAGLLVILIGSLCSRKVLIPKRDSWWKIVKLGTVQTLLQYLLFYIGLAHTTGVKASIIEASNVFCAILFAAFVFRMERLTVRKIVGCLIGFCGVVLINLTPNGLDASMSWLGEGAVFFSAVAYALSSGLIKRYSEHENPLVLSGYQFVFGGAALMVIAWCSGATINAPTLQSGALLIYLALVSAVAYSIWGILLKYNDIGRVAVFGFTNPVFGVILSALLLHESNQAFGWRGLSALALVCLGIFIVNYVKKRPIADRVNSA